MQLCQFDRNLTIDSEDRVLTKFFHSYNDHGNLKIRSIIFSAKRDFLSNFGRMHHGYHLCKIILNLGLMSKEPFEQFLAYDTSQWVQF